MPNDIDIENIENIIQSIINRLLVKSTLIQPGPAIAARHEFSSIFVEAVSLYRAGAFREAKDQFSNLADSADAERQNAGFTPRLNAAACAAASNDWSVVIDLLTPIFITGHLYGNPLWNLAIAYYHLNRITEALKALEIWVNTTLKWHRARGLLLIAALEFKNGDKTRAKDALDRAIEADGDYVANQIIFLSPQNAEKNIQSQSPPSQRPLDPAARDRLLALVQPKRPERRPELTLLLPVDAMEIFTTAIEEIAEGRFEQAKAHLVDLQERLPNVQHLRFALGACELFIGNLETAKEILLPAIKSGSRILGSALWNLACVQIRLGDFTGAREALLKCSETEYKTKGQLWLALGLLTPGAKRDPQIGPSKVVPIKNGPHLEPQSLAQRRRAQLERLIKPRKIPPSYKPDISKLTINDRQTVEQILQEASNADPLNALSMLIPWIARHPTVFTLKVRGAAFALFANDFPEASRLLSEASNLRPLDISSRWNLAYVSLCNSDYLGVIKALESGGNSPMAEKSEYWLALAVARATCGDSEQSTAAARSLALATSDVSRAAITQTLSACEIIPGAAVTMENPAMAAARTAQNYLDKNNLIAARECLNQICGDQFERVGEIGDRVFEPQFERLPDPKWNLQIANAFTAAVNAYEEGRAAEAAEDFRLLQELSPRPRIGANLVAALLKAGERQKAQSTARRIVSARTRHSWQIIYNHALAHNPNDYLTPVQLLERRIKDAHVLLHC